MRRNYARQLRRSEDGGRTWSDIIEVPFGFMDSSMIVDAHAKEHPSDRQPDDAIYSTAIFSDDGGATWQVSDWFPDGYTEEAALAELLDGRICYNSRSHAGYYDRERARPLPVLDGQLTGDGSLPD